MPDEHAPDFAGAFGRVAVVAAVDDVTWETSVRRGKGDGDLVTVSIEVDDSRL